MDDLWDYERWQYEVEMIIDWFVASPKHQSQTKDLTWEQLVAPEAVDLLIDDLGVPEISNTMHQLNFTESYYRYDIRAELSSREQVSASAQNNEYNDFWILTVDDANLELPHVIQPPSSKTRNSLFDVDQDSIHLNASFEELLESHEHWMAELLDNAEINTDDIYNFWCN
ncbi:hypothetical protein BKA66DRAFT_571337 [Pyrenochaeta sp. MPI-SDFR-AT-0127]|nr:hypothetical protein BKA66DRAFT_571337 [Pyrenochaeta sp. MPI-SDFR-AT-0127]